jgi:hypothetical protein
LVVTAGGGVIAGLGDVAWEEAAAGAAETTGVGDSAGSGALSGALGRAMGMSGAGGGAAGPVGARGEGGSATGCDSKAVGEAADLTGLDASRTGGIGTPVCGSRAMVSIGRRTSRSFGGTLTDGRDAWPPALSSLDPAPCSSALAGRTVTL